jgi:hypothetical protein
VYSDNSSYRRHFTFSTNKAFFTKVFWFSDVNIDVHTWDVCIRNSHSWCGTSWGSILHEGAFERRLGVMIIYEQRRVAFIITSMSRCYLKGL